MIQIYFAGALLKGLEDITKSHRGKKMKELAIGYFSRFQTILLLLSSVPFLCPGSVVGAPCADGLILSSPKTLHSQQQLIDNPTAQLVFGKEECKRLALNHADTYEFEIKETEANTVAARFGSLNQS